VREETLGVLLALIVGYSVALGQVESVKVYTVSGVGAFPISAEMTSMWLAAPGGRPLIMVYFYGPAGWHNTEWKTSSKFEKGMPGWAEYTTAKARQRIWLDADSGKAEVQAEKVNIQEANTYLVLHMTEKADLQRVVPLGKFDLPRSRDDPASVILLGEHPELVDKIKKVTGAAGG
jgi:hypothetical protein